MTNAERIRQMTDEELEQIVVCPYPICQVIDADCHTCILKWLREEADDDNHLR